MGAYAAYLLNLGTNMFAGLLQYSSDQRLQAIGRLLKPDPNAKIEDLLRDLQKSFGFGTVEEKPKAKSESESESEEDSTGGGNTDAAPQKNSTLINLEGRISSLEHEVKRHYQQNFPGEPYEYNYNNFNQYLTGFHGLSPQQLNFILYQSHLPPYAQALIQGAQDISQGYSYQPAFNMHVTCININNGYCSVTSTNGVHFFSQNNNYSDFIHQAQNVVNNTIIIPSPNNISIFSQSDLGEIGSNQNIQHRVKIHGNGYGSKIMTRIFEEQERINKAYQFTPMHPNEITRDIESFENSLNNYFPEMLNFKKELKETLIEMMTNHEFDNDTEMKILEFLRNDYNGYGDKKDYNNTKTTPNKTNAQKETTPNKTNASKKV
ncbi:MAG: hypothetical protein K9G11_03175 [Rickettsiaceae bacterium]|nr:hypothetical protein [Rickettsiaceae bacterium]